MPRILLPTSIPPAVKHSFEYISPAPKAREPPEGSQRITAASQHALSTAYPYPLSPSPSHYLTMSYSMHVFAYCTRHTQTAGVAPTPWYSHASSALARTPTHRKAGDRWSVRASKAAESEY